MKKRLWFKTFSLASAASIVAVAASCGTDSLKQNKSYSSTEFTSNLTKNIDYDFGLATEPINNLNYIKYNSMNKILPSLVDSFMKTGPNRELKSILKIKQFDFVSVSTDGTFTTDASGEKQPSSNFDDFFRLNKSELSTDNGYGRVQGSWYALHDLGLIGGLAKDTSGAPQQNASIYSFRNPKNGNNYIGATGFTNNKLNRWSNGDVVNAQDLRDYIEYILDLNTGSQKIDTITKYSFRNASKFIDAQKAYIQKFNIAYKNPWGRRKYIKTNEGTWIQDPEDQVWQSQIKDANGKALDIAEVEAIKQAALGFGFYTGQLFLDYPNEEIEANLNLPENKDFKLDKDLQEFTFLDIKTNKKYKRKLIKNVYLNPYQTFTIIGSLTDPNKKTIYSSIKSLARDENSFTIIFDENQTPELVYLIFTILGNLFPANRRYIETEGGGIQKYGSNTKKFLTSGPFLMDSNDVVLGPQGYINLKKNKDYFDAENTISEKIKIIFSTDRNINATFFEDGFISQTYIPAERINQYWSNPTYKEYLNKNTGYGTIAFGFNLDYESNADSYVLDEDLRNAIYYAINREKILQIVGWDFSFPVNTWTAYGQYRTFDGKNIETYFQDMRTEAANDKIFDLQNYDFVTHLSKSYTFEKTKRIDKTYDPKTAEFYLNRFKQRHPNLKHVKLRYLNNSSDEQKKAGTYLRNVLNELFKGYIDIEVKSLPENAFASFIEEGKYDIIYQNYDRLGGNGASDYVQVFFKTDEIDSLNEKNIGFKTNPVGSFTYADYISDLYTQAINLNVDEYISQHLVLPFNVILGSIPNAAADFDKVRNQQNPQKTDILNFENKYAQQILNGFKDATGKDFNIRLFKYLIEFLLIKNKNIQVNRRHKLLNESLLIFEGIDKLAEATASTSKRLHFQESLGPLNQTTKISFWKKFVELSFIKPTEDGSNYTDRINSFFSGNFNSEELKEKWSQEYVYIFIGELEKVIRDASIVVPLMEVDTNWEITRVGGVDSLYRFSLQYAYDFTRPPRPGLPRKRGS
ncbi:oligopeptide transport system substrate-binding protein [Mycoplasmopsis mustelae]|uniref:Oligopeptide transport system substrate-binding protein n=1 Tax=Mycoplasmopsis mustelae TaxID=171289 RepID=A0A4R7UCV6_9BACT|nr:ABC transporter substrate-binding protein [Mycoplasmopsis mustelae]TDV24278.1 oligopeptide transport system substrate-binding protein [Mycoplasmopsis mustelae]